LTITHTNQRGQLVHAPTGPVSRMGLPLPRQWRPGPDRVWRQSRECLDCQCLQR